MAPAETIVVRKPVPQVNIGIDVGSTTTKLVAIDSFTHEVLFSYYGRHHACQAESLINLFSKMTQTLPMVRARVAICGSGGLALAQTLRVPYIQEVVANATAIKAQFPEACTAIELGGQDAKMIFFAHDAHTKEFKVSDMRMNGSCAGGTGAFLDEIATLLQMPIEEFNDLAEQGRTLYDISGRCGVFAKTDIQPLLNQGAARSDIALSTFHALARQTIGGLAQGASIKAPVVFCGGPLTFNPRLVEVFRERLGFTSDETLIPQHPETFVALGAALSLNELFINEDASIDLVDAIAQLKKEGGKVTSCELDEMPLFLSQKDQRAFALRHAKQHDSLDMSGQRSQKNENEASQNYDELCKHQKANKPQVEERVIHCYLGIDSGSTTSKFALLDEDGKLIDSFYASNQGEPLKVLKSALASLYRRYKQQNTKLNIIAVGTTGYGELLFAKALGADYHVVETVAHMRAAQEFEPEVSFILDIGGQDMKAIWVKDGVITNILVNEACSSGCGSFLESFASSLGVQTNEIASCALASQNPAKLGSRCTVFMNSSIVSEQKNGKTPNDILAGLCRSIIKNVFTKVVRISSAESLGSKIVVQGGTFQNDAVLRSLEEYLGRDVTRAPYPGLMGAIGAALLTKEEMAAGARSSFIGLEAMEDFSFEQTANLTCTQCANRCNRTRIDFSNGECWVTGNKCSKGEQFEDRLKQEPIDVPAPVPDMMKIREELLFKAYPYKQLAETNATVIGLPRVLSYWETLPFWRAFFSCLGFTVKVSKPSTRKLYEQGLSAVTSDTVCFPAKLVHGHVRDLSDKKVDCIFMPSITTVTSENTETTSESMCAVVKGYPIVMRNSDNPESFASIPFETPLFHWYTNEDRAMQLSRYMEETFGVASELTLQAIKQGDAAQESFKQELEACGKQILDEVRAKGNYAVVLAARPYHTDPLVNHGLASIFTEQGIPVLTADAVPGQSEVDLSKSRIDIVNNYHARMLSTSLIAANNEHLEYVQFVSFGCGHDAYLSDEIIRLMDETSGKAPLILKLDESDIQGPLRIRVRSFLETVRLNRMKDKKITPQALTDPYPVKFEAQHQKTKSILVPNTSHAFCRLMTAAFIKQGYRAEALDIGREDAIRLGKKYVHNDICFPAQIVIGEALSALESGKYDPSSVAIGMARYVGDCRLTHYSALLRKALDDAGYEQVPIITNDDVDSHALHPGFKLSLSSMVRIVAVLPMIDVLEELLRKIRPYETLQGSTNEAFERALDLVIQGLEKSGIRGAIRGFKQAIELMKIIEYDRSNPRPRVLIVGEYLLNFHPGANNDIEEYLEKNGLEVIEARMTDVIRKTYFYKNAQIKEYDLNKPFTEKAFLRATDWLFERAHDKTDSIASAHPLYEPAMRMPELVKESDPVIHHTFDAGEGVLIPGEILHHAKRGCEAFVILQPFGCLPNHVVGRGISKKLKEMYPMAHIQALDYDPDISFANIENRLQMLIMSVFAKEATQHEEEGDSHDNDNDDDNFFDENVLNLDFINWDELLEAPEEASISLNALVESHKTDPIVKSLRTCAQYYKLYMAVTVTRIANQAAGVATHIANAASSAAQYASSVATQAANQAATVASQAADHAANVATQVADHAISAAAQTSETATHATVSKTS